MSIIEDYLLELRVALGDRMPPEVYTERIREMRAHLLESAAEVGESEALRARKGYGERARAGASGLRHEKRVELHAPLAAGLLVTGAGSILMRVLPAMRLEDLGAKIMFLFVLAFTLRAA